METYPVYYIDYYKKGDTLPCRSTIKEHFYYREEVLTEAIINLELSDADKAIIRYKDVALDSNVCADSKILYEIHKRA